MADENEREEELHRDSVPVEQELFDEAEDQLMSIFLKETDEKPRQYSIIFTCFLFTFLFLVSLPRGTPIEMPDEVIFVPDIDQYIPPMKEPPKIEKRELEQVKKVALPDPTPEEPEPIHEPIPEPEPEPLPPNVKVMRGLPRGPPRGRGPVVEGTAGLTRPRKIKDVEPQYPMIAKRAGVGGTVHLRAIITRKGDVTNVELLKGIGRFQLDEAAMDAVKKWKYEPGMLEGKAVDVIMTVRVNFIVTG